MVELKAFIGHSFSAEDEVVVRAFLDYFDKIQKMDIGFSWVHAKPAEPKLLAEKVLNLIDDKNLFIGICTKSERAAKNGKLKKRMLCGGLICAKSDTLEWKTTDWIIQEIGLAIGRKMRLILLVENGLRPPGGLQGNIEYILFERQSLEKSFGKLLEMITALSDKTKQIEKTSVDIQVTENIERSDKPESEYFEPKPEWNRNQYEFALTHMVATDDGEGQERIYKAYLETDEANNESKRDAWLAINQYVQIWGG